jgi:TPR repeat protein
MKTFNPEATDTGSPIKNAWALATELKGARRYTEALDLMLEMSEKGYHIFDSRIAIMHEFGGPGLSRQPELAEKYYLSYLSEFDDDLVRFCLGRLYVRVPSLGSPEKAIELLESVAHQEDPVVCFLVGIAYRQMGSDEVNLDIALAKFLHAADGGHEVARVCTGLVLLRKYQLLSGAYHVARGIVGYVASYFSRRTSARSIEYPYKSKIFVVKTGLPL